MALMKVEVWSGGTNVAEGCPVADSFKGNLGVTNLTLKRRPQDDVVTDNPGNVIPADQWKPVAYKAQLRSAVCIWLMDSSRRRCKTTSPI